ncbi:MAG: hypothetical protein ACREP9_16685, partial [Candidatus Dormibacteraceae bacterium]
VIDSEPAAPRSLVPCIPRDLETLCLKCLQKEPARRYDSAGELAEELDRFLAFKPIRARRVTAVERAWRWCARRKALVGAWTAAILLPTALALVASHRADALRLGRAPVLPLSVAYTAADKALDDTNWTFSISNLAGMSEAHARQIRGYTNPPFPVCTNPVREMTYQMGPTSTLLAFHLCSNATYDPALRGEIKELAASIVTHQIDGAGNTRVAPCLEQDGKLYSYTRPQAASTADLAEIFYRGMRAEDFSLPQGVDYMTRAHPDFSFHGRPLRMGYLVRDTDPKRGHYGWVAVSSFGVTAFGPTPASFPFTDPSFSEDDWIVRALPDGSPVTWEERRERTGGNPGRHLLLNLKLGNRTGLELIHLCQNALYSPAIQGALESVDVSIDTRMAAESSGRSANANICPVILQNGALHAAGWRMATYSEQHGGWVPLDFLNLGARQFAPYINLPGSGAPAALPYFSTNGAPIRFGFATRHVTFYNNPQGRAFSASVDFDNFAIKVHAVPSVLPEH